MKSPDKVEKEVVKQNQSNNILNTKQLDKCK